MRTYSLWFFTLRPRQVRLSFLSLLSLSIPSHPFLRRSYLTFDIIRRILEDYFGYSLFVCMNITDIDDKIILKARRNYLFAEYAKAHTELTDEVIKDIQESVDFYIRGLEKKIAGYKARPSRLILKLCLTLWSQDDLVKGKGNATEVKAELGLATEKLGKAQVRVVQSRYFLVFCCWWDFVGIESQSWSS